MLQASGESELWAITSFFNPIGYRRRLENYKHFRRHLTVPLLTVELSFSGDFELSDSDADILVQIRGGDVLDQKERLLNLALSRLPASCKYVAWLDCDLLFLNDEWPQLAIAALERSPIAQLFSIIHYLPKPALAAIDAKGGERFFRRGLAALVAGGSPFATVYNEDSFTRRLGSASPGHAWAARRSLLDRHRLYDACTVGGADSAINCASYGAFEIVIRNHKMNLLQKAHYLRWAEPFFASVHSNVSYVPGEVLHLWHGEIADRHTEDNYTAIKPFAFDPATDLALSGSGSWMWNTDKPQLHQYVRCYFANRDEDG